jgi:ATP/ADP translocase
MAQRDLRFRLLSFLLLFLFGGAIVGETVSLSMVVTVSGSAVLGKLFFVNGALLFLLPPLFFSNIDRINRGKLFSVQLLAVSCILVCYLTLFLVVGKENIAAVSFWLLLIYPISYLSKTTLFLSFWTLANDIYTTDEAKKGFPKIASWGFVGGLSGACGARLLLEVVDAQMIIGLWAAAYLVAFAVSRKITAVYWIKFAKREIPNRQQAGSIGIIAGIKLVWSNNLIRLMAALYFLVFVAIFLQDYLFWKKSAAWFPSSNALASFQFTFYLAYSIVIIGGLRFVMPGMITRWGFTRIFSLLPLTLLTGSGAMIIMIGTGAGPTVSFAGFLGFQFLRYVVFENAFSPIYQMFFAVIPREKRGRAKTFLDGIVKPSAIMLTGLFLMFVESNALVLLGVVAFASAVMVYVVARIRRTYTEALIPVSPVHAATDDIIAEIGSRHDQELFAIVNDYSASRESDIRRLAVRILAHEGSKQAYRAVRAIYEKETDQSVREAIAQSLSRFSGADAAEFFEAMLRDENPRVRANALFSLNTVDRSWKGRFYDTVKMMFFENNPRVQIEAARFLWQVGDSRDQSDVQAFLKYLLSVKSANRRSGGLYLVGALRPEGWENTLLANLDASSLQVFTKSVEIILASASRQTQLDALGIADGLTRRHIAIVGTAVAKQGDSVMDVVCEFLRTNPTKRMTVELIRSLRGIVESSAGGLKKRPLDAETSALLSAWIIRELQDVYRDCTVWRNIGLHADKKQDGAWMFFLEDALREHLGRVCEWALDVAALLDPRGVMVAGRRDLDVKEYTQRFNLIELLDNFGPHHITMLITPILRRDSWDLLAKTGRGFFSFDDGSGAGGIRYFISSSNRWICLCALYSLWKTSGTRGLLSEEREALERLVHDTHSPVATAAAQLLSASKDTDAMKIDAFNLLERVMSLKKTPLFGTVSAEKLMELAEATQRFSYKAGTLISREGELSDHLYIVAGGSLKIVKAKNGVKTILSIVGKGETYGEIGLFNQAPRSASAIANEDCELWVIQRSALKKILLDMPEIAYNLLEVFSEKLRRSGEEVALLNTTLSSSIKELTVDEK